MSAPNACVRRNGEESMIPASELVPGDIVLLEDGSIVPADLRLIHENSLAVQESALTGESVPVEKDCDAALKEETPLGSRVNMAYTSSIVMYGNAEGVVIATGMHTEVGQIANLLDNQDELDTPLKKKLNSVGKTLSIVGLIICIVIFAIGSLYKQPWIPLLMTAVSLAISIIPEGLPATATIVMALGVQRMAKQNALIRKLPAVETLGMIVLFCIKEAVMLFMGYLAMHYAKSINSAKWYGKACTVVLDVSMVLMVLIPSISKTAINIAVTFCCCAMVLSLAMYLHFYVTLLKNTPLWLEHKDAWKKVYKISIGCIWTVVFLILLINKDRFSVDEVLRYSPANPVLAAMTMMLLFALKSVSIVIYCGILYAADGLLFPLPVAIVLNIIGTAIMVTIPYFIGKRSGKELSQKILSRFPKAGLIKTFRDKNDFMFTLIVRLIGLLPCDIVSLYFGACQTNYPKYLAACIVGMLPPIITLPIIGTNASNVGSPQFIISVCVDVCCMLGSLTACAVIKARQNDKEGKK